ncbi:hypothetical protein NFI96_025436 [Prochilodus magdalenae]|nr:hypothetical protein NFI96_025436 [Prochilodus magdalenae]
MRYVRRSPLKYLHVNCDSKAGQAQTRLWPRSSRRRLDGGLSLLALSWEIPAFAVPAASSCTTQKACALPAYWSARPPGGTPSHVEAQAVAAPQDGRESKRTRLRSAAVRPRLPRTARAQSRGGPPKNVDEEEERGTRQKVGTRSCVEESDTEDGKRELGGGGGGGGEWKKKRGRDGGACDKRGRAARRRRARFSRAARWSTLESTRLTCQALPGAARSARASAASLHLTETQVKSLVPENQAQQVGAAAVRPELEAAT